jgi:hypothetical protein
MIKFTTVFALATLLLATFTHGFVMPVPPVKSNCHCGTTTQLDFQRTEENTFPRVYPTYKVTKFQFDDGLEREKTGKRKTLVTNIRGKAVDFLLRSYEIDQLEYGL